MTGPVTTEALRDALARSAIQAKFGPEGVAVIFDTPDEATDHQRAVLTARAEEALRVADFAIAGPLAPLLASLQQVTAERDEAREVVARCNNSFGSYSYHLNPHPAEQIEKVKWQARSEWQRAEAAEAALATATAEAASLRAEVEAVLDEATRMSSILLMAGEMTAQERRTARAVALGISLKVHTALARAATAREGAPQSVLRHLSDEERQARAKALGEARQQEIAAALNREEADRG